MKKAKPYILMAPTIVIYAAVSLFPVIYLIILSFQKVSIYKMHDVSFVGFSNYISLVNKPEFWSSLQFTFIYTFGAVLIEFILGFAIALLFNHSFPGLKVCRGLLILPMVIAPILSALTWRTALDSTYGIVNNLLGMIGIDPIFWLSDRKLVRFTVIMVDTWCNTPYMFFVITSGLQSIPEEFNEVAQIEGANRFQKFRYVTVPTIKSVLLIGIIFRTMGAFRAYDLIYGLTSGGPGSVTANASYYAYKLAFSYDQIGEGAAVSVMLLIAIVIICACISNFMSELWSNKQNTTA